MIVTRAPNPPWTNYVRDVEIARRMRALEDRDRFRIYLSEGVRTASPILVSALRLGYFDLEKALRRMRPSPALPRSGLVAWLGPGWSHRSRMTARNTDPRSGFEGRHRWMAACLRGAQHPGGRLGIRVDAGSLAIEMALGTGLLMTHGGVLGLHVDGDLPEAVKVAALGRHVGDVVQHPLFSRGHYPIVSIGSCMDGTMLITARAPLVSLLLPLIQG